MRKFVLLLALLGAPLPAAPASAQVQAPRTSQEAYRSVRRGGILPLNVIRERVRIPGAVLIAVDLVADGAVYRLRFMRGGDTAIVAVDARTGQRIACAASNEQMCR